MSKQNTFIKERETYRAPLVAVYSLQPTQMLCASGEGSIDDMQIDDPLNPFPAPLFDSDFSLF